MNRLWILLLAGCLALPAIAEAAETKVIPSPSSLPSGATVGGGAGVDRAKIGGVLYVSTDALGNVGAPETNMMAYAIPANTLDRDGKLLRATAFGSTAANANGKTIKCYFGAQNIGTISPGNDQDWIVLMFVIRTGANGQVAFSLPVAQDNTPSSVYTTPTEDTTNSINFRCTGDGVADNDIVQRGLIVEILN